MLTNEQKKKLIQAAREAALFAYAPYSRFRVGAALLCADGTIVHGTNVENRSYGLTSCAERNACFTAVGAAQRDFLAIAICSPDRAEPLPPCGACRQVLSELAAPDLLVIMAGETAIIEKPMTELLPLDALHELKR